MTDGELVLLAKFDLVLARLDALSDQLKTQRGDAPVAPPQSLTPKVQAALMRATRDQPRDVVIRIQSAVREMTLDGVAEGRIISALERGDPGTARMLVESED